MPQETEPDLIREIHDMDDKERADAFRRWVELSELVAPRRQDESSKEATEGSVPEGPGTEEPER